jgi:predicted  nucleic acid-binding Zn-ribbon protein
MEQINKQYESLCAKAGDLQYKIKQHQEALAAVNSQIDILNNLAAEVSKTEAANE